MEQDLKNKVAVITGASEGIGYAIADNFIQNGAKVILLDINSVDGEGVTKAFNLKYGESAMFIKCDVTSDLNDVYDKIFAIYDYVDILINNAGIADEVSARRIMDVNAIALIEWSVKFYDKMRVDKGGKGGTIINMSSIYGYLIDPYMMYYKASKFAVFGFSKSYGHVINYDRSKVRVVVVCPGKTETKMIYNNAAWDEHREGFSKMISESEGQTTDEVGKMIVEIFKNAASGTAWLVASGKMSEIS